ncbi:MAG: membrane integrity-associated transporter subunit PqiC [Gemmatimonadales bacterium]|nr:MAG: membrane integrity-associated transporter subunit PqiC [Gemmatimonadales bacterium]
MWTLIRSRATRLLLLATLLSMAGCFSLSRDAPPQRHYVLGSGGAAQAISAAVSPVADSSAHLVGLRLPRVADYLASPFIVVRRGAHQVEFSEYHRWGEDLGQAINRTVAGLLAERAPRHRIVTAPWPGGTSPDRVIQLHILRFEGVAPEHTRTGAGAAHLLATWEILRPLDGSLLGRGTIEVREDGWSVGDFDGLVRLLDTGLEALAEDLARHLGEATIP